MILWPIQFSIEIYSGILPAIRNTEAVLLSGCACPALASDLMIVTHTYVCVGTYTKNEIAVLPQKELGHLCPNVEHYYTDFGALYSL